MITPRAGCPSTGNAHFSTFCEAVFVIDHVQIRRTSSICLPISTGFSKIVACDYRWYAAYKKHTGPMTVPSALRIHVAPQPGIYGTVALRNHFCPCVRAPFLPYYFTVHDTLGYIRDQRWNIIMYVLVLASQKGGAGKTTLSRHLAVEAERAGEGPVVLIDADPQGGLAGWWNRRRAESPVFFASRLEDLPKHIDQARLGGFKLVIIDTPPQATGLIRAVVALADLVLIPTRPSPDDLDAVGRTIDIVDEAKKPMVFVINGATKNARITGQAAIALSQSGTVATATIHHSVAFPTSGIDGRTVTELDLASNSAQEITELWTYVSARLRKYVKEAA